MRLTRRLRKLLARAGIHLYSSNVIWTAAEDFLAVNAAVDREGIRGNDDDRCYVLYRLAQRLREVPGDVMECGSRFGKSSRFIMAGLGRDSDKALHAFDSFEGLSAPGDEDRVAGRPGGFAWKAGDLASDETRFLHNMRAHAPRVIAYKGWIPERFGEVADRTFALVHIDVDLYQPTRDTLEFAYERIPPRGVILCDDYGSVSCPGAKQAVDEFFADKPENIVEMTNICALVVKAG